MSQRVETEQQLSRQGFFKRYFKRPLGVIALLYLLLLLIASIRPAWLARGGDPEAVDFMNILSGPTEAHRLGTDALGRDILVRLIYATSTALTGAALAVSVAVCIAVPLGLVVGLKRGWVDLVTTRIAEILQSIPSIMIVLMVMALTGQSMTIAMMVFGVLVSPGALRVVRSVTLAVNEEPYIAAARIAGLNDFQIAVRHVLPRVAGPILVNMSVISAVSLLSQAALNFLNLGVRPPNPTWGSMLAEGSQNLLLQPWDIIPPGVAIGLAILSLVLTGDTLRDTFTETWARPRSTPSRKEPVSHAAAMEGQICVEQERPLLQVRDLSVTFGTGNAAVSPVLGVSFDIKPGEAMGLVGESGCGKTLTGLAVLGLLPGAATAKGSVKLDGSDLLTMSKRDRKALRGSTIAFISQEPMVALDPLFTVGQQIGEAVRTHTNLRGRAVHERVLKLLSDVKIVDAESVAKRLPHEISGGMAQRVAMAIALAGEPALLIADEPTTALDVSVQKEILELLATLQREHGMAVLLVSHDWGVVAELCERAVVMYAGQVVEQGTVTSITRAATHPYSRGLMAANPHFAVPGQPLTTIPGAVPPPAEWPASCHFMPRCAIATEACAAAAIPLVKTGEQHLSRCIRAHEIETAMVEHGMTVTAS